MYSMIQQKNVLFGVFTIYTTFTYMNVIICGRKVSGVIHFC